MKILANIESPSEIRNLLSLTVAVALMRFPRDYLGLMRLQLWPDVVQTLKLLLMMLILLLMMIEVRNMMMVMIVLAPGWRSSWSGRSLCVGNLSVNQSEISIVLC